MYDALSQATDDEDEDDEQQEYGPRLMCDIERVLKNYKEGGHEAKRRIGRNPACDNVFAGFGGVFEEERDPLHREGQNWAHLFTEKWLKQRLEEWMSQAPLTRISEADSDDEGQTFARYSGKHAHQRKMVWLLKTDQHKSDEIIRLIYHAWQKWKRLVTCGFPFCVAFQQTVCKTNGCDVSFTRSQNTSKSDEARRQLALTITPDNYTLSYRFTKSSLAQKEATPFSKTATYTCFQPWSANHSRELLNGKTNVGFPMKLYWSGFSEYAILDNAPIRTVVSQDAHSVFCSECILNWLISADDGDKCSEVARQVNELIWTGSITEGNDQHSDVTPACRSYINTMAPTIRAEMAAAYLEYSKDAASERSSGWKTIYDLNDADAASAPPSPWILVTDPGPEALECREKHRIIRPDSFPKDAELSNRLFTAAQQDDSREWDVKSRTVNIESVNERVKALEDVVQESRVREDLLRDQVQELRTGVEDRVAEMMQKERHESRQREFKTQEKLESSKMNDMAGQRRVWKTALGYRETLSVEEQRNKERMGLIFGKEQIRSLIHARSADIHNPDLDADFTVVQHMANKQKLMRAINWSYGVLGSLCEEVGYLSNTPRSWDPLRSRFMHLSGWVEILQLDLAHRWFQTFADSHAWIRCQTYDPSTALAEFNATLPKYTTPISLNDLPLKIPGTEAAKVWAQEYNGSLDTLIKKGTRCLRRYLDELHKSIKATYDEWQRDQMHNLPLHNFKQRRMLQERLNIVTQACWGQNEPIGTRAIQFTANLVQHCLFQRERENKTYNPVQGMQPVGKLYNLHPAIPAADLKTANPVATMFLTMSRPGRDG